jgi:hypothetical protein
MMDKEEFVEPWRSRVPPGVPGAGWLVATVFALAVIVFGSWVWAGSHKATAAPTASQSTSH